MRRNSFLQFHTTNDSFRHAMLLPCFKVPYHDKVVSARRYLFSIVDYKFDYGLQIE